MLRISMWTLKSSKVGELSVEDVESGEWDEIR